MLKRSKRLQDKHDWLAFVMGPMFQAKAMRSRFNDAVENDANTDQPVTDQGDTGQPATDVTPSDNGENGQPATDNQTEPGPVPYERFQEVNEAKKNAEMQVTQMQQQFQQYLAAHQQPQQQQSDPFSEFMQKEGIGADGFLTPDDLKKVYQFNQKQAEQTVEQSRQEQWYASHPDYIGIVQTPGGQMSEHLSNAIKNDPTLGMKLRKNWDPVLAYHAARAEAVSKKPSSPPGPQIPTSRPPQGISAASSAGGAGTDMGSQVQAMNDDQLRSWLHSRSG